MNKPGTGTTNIDKTNKHSILDTNRVDNTGTGIADADKTEDLGTIDTNRDNNLCIDGQLGK